MNENVMGCIPLHSHDSCPQKALASKVYEEMKLKMKEIGATSSKITNLTMQETKQEAWSYLPKKASMKRSLQNHKVRNSIANPITANFEIPEQFAEMILYDSGVNDEQRILAIGDREFLKKLNNDTIFGDGTFDKVPVMFYQLYTWHIKVGNAYPPCVYFLLQRKDQNTYSRMFEILKSLIPNFTPAKILVDFEKACINAAAMSFPGVTIKGCYFHLTQSLIRKINSEGLKLEYESNIDSRLALKSLTALAFVPTNDVKRVFHTLATSFPNEERYENVLNYFMLTYIEGAAGRDPLFPITIWNQYLEGLEQLPRTTNCCEGFHNALNSLFHHSHPNIWEFLDRLKGDITNGLFILKKTQEGEPVLKRRKYILLDQKIATLVGTYQVEEDKLSYLKKVANLQ